LDFEFTISREFILHGIKVLALISHLVAIALNRRLSMKPQVGVEV
jgi:hypothetical protein